MRGSIRRSSSAFWNSSRLQGLAAQELRAIQKRKAAEREALGLIACPDPVVYARDHLGIQPWTRQEEILRAAAAHPRVAVRSGHKISKSCSAATLALWWYQTRPRALVVLTSSTDDQIRLILWSELRRLHLRALRPIGGELHESHRTGLVAPDGRRIVGIATNATERMGGFSGAELLFIADEASGIAEEIFDAIEGNRAGGARLVMFGNPTQTSGRFYDAFHSQRSFWHTIHVSSEEAAAYQREVRQIPGLATQGWVDEKQAEWGEESPLYQVRVRGNFPTQAENAVIGLAVVEGAVQRGRGATADGPLELGVDVARFGDDETILQPRRGLVALPVKPLRSMDGTDIGGKVLELVRELRRPGERPRVKVDVIGVGASVVDFLSRQPEVMCIPVNVGEAATSKPAPGEPGFVRLRDQLWFGCRDWLRGGGAIPDDAQLQAELVAPTYRFAPNGDYKVESKDDLKKRLKRSPDRADALCLAVYNPPPGPFVGTIDEGDWMAR